MSAKFSTSPALRLTIGKSRIRTFLHRALCCCVLLALSLAYLQSYLTLALLLSPFAALLLWLLSHDSGVASIVCWQDGMWMVERNGHAQIVSISQRSTGLPWVIYLAWQKLPAGRRESVWLFADSAPAQQLRRLRVRLSLQR